MLPSLSREDSSVPEKDPVVKVTFDPTKNPQFTFNEPEVRMTNAGRIILRKDPTSATWRFLGATVKDDTLNEFRVRIPRKEGQLHIMDDCLDEQVTTYSYNVTVHLDGVTYTSPDPVIVNDPDDPFTNDSNTRTT
jgi:hypothetical protein